MYVKKITFGLENCERIEIDKNVIGELIIDDIRQCIHRTACNAIEKYWTAHYVAVEIFGEGDVPYNPFDLSESCETVFHRLCEFNDIAYIEVEYESGRKENYYVNYDSDKLNDIGEENKNQKHYISDLGNLYIVISDAHEIKDVFNLDEINDKQYIDGLKELYDIGNIEYDEHLLSYDYLPDYYRYVILSERNGKERWNRNYHTAVRVPYHQGWKFVYQDESHRLNIPDIWQYLDDKSAKWLEEHHQRVNDGFSISQLKTKYPQVKDE